MTANKTVIYNAKEIAQLVAPVAKKYHLRTVYLFGSYARGEATADSDIDLLVDLDGTQITSLFSMHGAPSFCELQDSLEEALHKKVDLITVRSFESPATRRSDLLFRKHVLKERLEIYGAA